MDLEQDTYYLPNPTDYTDNACVNSVVYFGFTNNMDDDTVETNATIYRCTVQRHHMMLLPVLL